MDLTYVEKIAEAVLYEGYMLYPYRASSVKNRQRFNWGSLVPAAYSEAHNGTEHWEMRTECLARGPDKARITVRVRFLQLSERKIGRAGFPSRSLPDDIEWVETLEVGDNLYQEWQEAIEKQIDAPTISLSPDGGFDIDFAYSASHDAEGIRDADGLFAGVITRDRNAIRGTLSVELEALRDDVYKVIVTVRNTTDIADADNISRDDALLRSIVSTHTILGIEGGEFISLLEPPDRFADLVAKCESYGTYPVLAGEDGGSDCMLSSPIILYDHPQIAPESAGDLFDGTEIDEILTLRIMTLTEDEKREMRSVDDRARRILERTEMMPEEQLMKMHGALRDLKRSRGAAHG